VNFNERFHTQVRNIRFWDNNDIRVVGSIVPLELPIKITRHDADSQIKMSLFGAVWRADRRGDHRYLPSWGKTPVLGSGIPGQDWTAGYHRGADQDT